MIFINYSLKYQHNKFQLPISNSKISYVKYERLNRTNLHLTKYSSYHKISYTVILSLLPTAMALDRKKL